VTRRPVAALWTLAATVAWMAPAVPARAAEVFVSLGLTPRNARRGYHRPDKRLVFMCEKLAMANAIEAAAVF